MRSWVELFFDGELSASKSGRVEAHLRECPSCRAEFDRLQKMRALIREGLSASVAGAGQELDAVAERVRQRLARETAEEARAGRHKDARRRAWGIRVLVPSAAVVMLLAAVIFTVYKPRTPVIQEAYTNECIIDSIESGPGTVMVFKTHGSRMTVIWVSEAMESDREAEAQWTRVSV